jgi:hypothetical protein
MLWCPSDPKITEPIVYPAGVAWDNSILPMRLTSYGANSGEFFNFDPINVRGDPNSCGFSADGSLGQQQMNGIVYAFSHVTLTAPAIPSPLLNGPRASSPRRM